MLALVREITALHAFAYNHAFAIELGEGSYRCFHLFGGRFRAGGRVEYAISAGVVIVCIGHSHITGGQGFAPLFFDWAGMYEQGLIDALEWKTNRFRLI